MNISINPSYFCNFRCDFCYLTPEQLGDQKKIKPEKLDQLLFEVRMYDKIEHIDLYGGEIGALKKSYYDEILTVIRSHYSGSININTNFSKLDDRFLADNITLSVSYDFAAREKSDLVYQNMLLSTKPIAVLILASPEVLKMDVDEMIKDLNIVRSITSVEIKPYSTNQANAHNVTHKDFEDFVIKWLESDVEKKFEFINLFNIEDSYNKLYNAFSDDHVYITPNGKFGVLEFDKNDNEYFLELPSYGSYQQWAYQEKITLSDICNNCKYMGHCLTEHYRYVKDLDNSCNGYINLLEWYDARMEDQTKVIS
jgi:sulfatase maturation enzyme AslB (radical SAM superfamily)